MIKAPQGYLRGFVVCRGYLRRVTVGLKHGRTGCVDGRSMVSVQLERYSMAKTRRPGEPLTRRMERRERGGEAWGIVPLEGLVQGVDGGVDAHLEGVVLRWVEGLYRGVDVVGQGYGDDALGALLLL